VSPPRGGRGFAARIVAWQAAHGRHDLPWQGSGDPYRVWLAEVMLQQTQVATVIPYYRRFCERFPAVAALAEAPLEDVLTLWAGLGYYARARNLHACAREVMVRFAGRFPLDARVLAQLPGIGRSTAAAIAAFCTGAREPILDGNVKRVLARHDAVAGDVSSAGVERLLWARAASLLPAAADMPAYTQGLMDLGATVCKRRAPNCGACPLARTCAARAAGLVEQLPAARRRRQTPVKRAWALLALHEGRVLLHRRAPAGVWGGLLALPQFDSAAALRRAAGAIDPAASLRTLPPRRHAFTHFTLVLMPRRLDVRAPLPALREDDLTWLPLAAIDSAPLPAPVHALLRGIAPSGGAAGERSVAAAGAPARAQPGASGSMPRATRKRETML
jgi:A/G-specific adenine glycosylase